MGVDVGPHDFEPLHPWDRVDRSRARCRVCYLRRGFHPTTIWTQARPYVVPGAWFARLVLAVIIAALLQAVVLVAQARADVHVSLEPAQRSIPVRTATTYIVTITTDSPVTLSDVVLLLPGHGQPCDQPDESGYPYGGDPSTNFQVLSPEPIVTGRWVSWPGPFVLSPDSSYEWDLDVLTPSVAACFFAGASAHADVPVQGIAQGGELDVGQHETFATGGYFTSLGAGRFELSWWTSASADSLMIRERLGLPAGFTLVSSTLGAGKRRKSPDSFSYQWDTPRQVPAGDYERESVVVDAPCSQLGSTIHARLRVWRSDGLVAGTGDGPPMTLPPC